MVPLVHTIDEACSAAKVGRTVLYEAIRSRALRAVKRGRRTLILDEDLRQWVYSLPQLELQATVSDRHCGGSCGEETTARRRANRAVGVPGE